MLFVFYSFAFAQNFGTPVLPAPGTSVLPTLDGGDDGTTPILIVVQEMTPITNVIPPQTDGGGCTEVWYRDVDGDGYGSQPSTLACAAPAGYVFNNTDCDDSNANRYPGNVITPAQINDGIDNDCDGANRDECWLDNDMDGVGVATVRQDNGDGVCSAAQNEALSTGDCADSNPDRYPGRLITQAQIDDGVDNDCDGANRDECWLDGDMDGSGVSIVRQDNGDGLCLTTQHEAATADDCDDTNAERYPGNVITQAQIDDGVDNDCDGANRDECWLDNDMDGSGVATVRQDNGDGTCLATQSEATSADDCDDSNATRYPNHPEICDGIDNDCDTGVDEGVQSTFYDDFDGDGRGDPADSLQACNAPSGHVSNSNDCDDTDPSIFEGATEVCDAKDNNCDGVEDNNATDRVNYYPDADGDNYGNVASSAILACPSSAPAGHVPNHTDCDDGASSIHPGATEACNDVDDDCDNSIDEGIALQTWYLDSDGDGYGGTISQQACGQPSGYLANSADCDDADANQHPGVAETCNGEDDNCNDQTDENATDALTWYADADADGFGSTTSTQACSQPGGHVANSSDCDDARSSAYPGATELCNALDDDCDNVVDNNISNATFYLDADGDGFGIDTDTRFECSPPAGYASASGDCDDSNSGVRPNALEVCNHLDDNCDGVTDTDATDRVIFYADTDGDGYGDAANSVLACAPPVDHVPNAGDCNDNQALAWEGAAEACDGVDNDCDGVIDPPTSTDASSFYIDADGDGYGDPSTTEQACGTPPGLVAIADDCDDLNATVNPDADEVCDTLDNDCDGTIDLDPIDFLTFYEDLDGDGFGTTHVLACTLQNGLALVDGDCDDTAPTTNPGAIDQCDDLIDNDCDGLVDENNLDIEWYEDLDGDNFGTHADVIIACAQPIGYAPNAGDCDDQAVEVHPGALETCDPLDSDCDGFPANSPTDGVLYYLDQDGDGFGDPNSAFFGCGQELDWVLNAGDCNDTRGDIAPSLEEVCDGVDNNCNGAFDENPVDGVLFYADTDGDGFGGSDLLVFACEGPLGSSSTSGDCDDLDANVGPDQVEQCGGGDEDCDGLVDDADPDLDTSSTLLWFRDDDQDGFGVGLGVEQCVGPEGWVEFHGDCDDGDATISPLGIEIPGDSIDQDCNGEDPDPHLDSDGDGIPDYIELAVGADPHNMDSDGDGVPDAEEGFVDPSQDTDGDGLADIIDEDDDGDGISTAEEGMDDTDNDGVPNYLDDDSDADGVPDSVESSQDRDGDGVPDYLDASTADAVDAPDVPSSYGVGCSHSSAPFWLGLMVLPFARRSRSPE